MWGHLRGIVCVKKPVFPFDRFPEVDPLLGPEMKSTGEAMGVGGDFGEAYAKAEAGAKSHLPRSGTVFLSVRDGHKRTLVFMAQQLVDMGFKLVATKGTERFLKLNGIPVEMVAKLEEGRPHAVDLLKAGNVQLVMNSTSDRRSALDGRAIRAAAMDHRVPCVTTLPGMIATVLALAWQRRGEVHVRALQDLDAAERKVSVQ